MEPEKKKLKISIFDIIILAVVILAAAAVILVFRPSRTAADNTASSGTVMQYTVELQQLPAGTAELIQPGDSVSDGARNYAMGKVVSAHAAPYTYQVADESTGEVKNAPLDRYENVIITIESGMNTSGSSLTTDSGFVVTVGTQVHVTGPCYAGTGYVIAIERGE